MPRHCVRKWPASLPCIEATTIRFSAPAQAADCLRSQQERDARVAEQQGVSAEVRSRLEALSMNENVLPGRLDELRAQHKSAKSQLAAQRTSLRARSTASEQMEQLVTRGTPARP